jgi:hypothetical protein
MDGFETEELQSKIVIHLLNSEKDGSDDTQIIRTM